MLVLAGVLHTVTANTGDHVALHFGQVLLTYSSMLPRKDVGGLYVGFSRSGERVQLDHEITQGSLSRRLVPDEVSAGARARAPDGRPVLAP